MCLGNSNLVYTIIRKRQVFYQLANLSTDAASISQSLKSKKTKIVDTTEKQPSSPTQQKPKSLIDEVDKPAFQSTLAATPELNLMTGGVDATQQNTQKTENEDWEPTPEWVCLSRSL